VPDARDLAEDFDLKRLPDSFYDDPYPTYRALREHAPVKRLADGGVFLSRYADVVAVYKDTATFSSDKHEEFFPKYGASPLFEHHTTSLVFNDPPLHTRVRRLIAGALTPRHIAAMEQRLIERVDSLPRRDVGARARRRRSICIGRFASAIPVEIIGNLLAVPSEERAPLRDWSLAILGARSSRRSRRAARARQRAGARVPALPQGAGRAAPRRARRSRGRRPDPAHRRRGRRDAERGRAAAQLHLPAQRRPRDDDQPDRQRPRLPARLAGPEGDCSRAGARAHRRRGVPALRELEPARQPDHDLRDRDRRRRPRAAHVGDDRHRRGQPRPEPFADPDRLDIARTPNRHVAFGSGIHQCVGMGLARLEGRVAIGRFLARFPNYRLAAPPLRQRRARFRGHARLVAVVDPLPPRADPFPSGHRGVANGASE
jgi:cytochrome P450